jgi:hypothetical protein
MSFSCRKSIFCKKKQVTEMVAMDEEGEPHKQGGDTIIGMIISIEVLGEAEMHNDIHPKKSKGILEIKTEVKAAHMTIPKRAFKKVVKPKRSVKQAFKNVVVFNIPKDRRSNPVQRCTAIMNKHRRCLYCSHKYDWDWQKPYAPINGLQCVHTLCKHCVLTLFQQRSNKKTTCIPCPKCKTPPQILFSGLIASRRFLQYYGGK